jgi:hypothetical protein
MVQTRTSSEVLLGHDWVCGCFSFGWPTTDFCSRCLKSCEGERYFKLEVDCYTFSALLILLLVFQFILRLACGFIEPTNLFALNVEGKPGGSSC